MVLNKSNRPYKVADVLHRELAVIIRDKISDPDIGMVTISDVEVSKDLTHARVYFTVLDETRKQATIDILNKATGFIRTKLAAKVLLRVVPSLRFYYDDSIANGLNMEALLEKVRPPFKDNADG
jgi:ribosome-binding factor A